MTHPNQLIRSNCPVCNSIPRTDCWLTGIHKGKWFTCPNCGLLWDPEAWLEWPNIKYRDHKGIILANYIYNTEEPKIKGAREGTNMEAHKNVLDKALYYTKKRGVFLEVGFGGGIPLELAHKSGEWDKVVGIEAGCDFVLFARARGIEAHYIDIQDAPTEKTLAGKVDLLLCSQCLEHVDRPVRFLAGMLPYLSADGIVVTNFSTAEQELHPGEWQYWTIKSVTKAIQRAGLAVVNLEDHKSLIWAVLKR